MADPWAVVCETFKALPEDQRLLIASAANGLLQTYSISDPAGLAALDAVLAYLYEPQPPPNGEVTR